MNKYKIYYQKNNKKKSIILFSNDIKNEKKPNNLIKIVFIKEDIKKSIKINLLMEFILKLNRILQVNIDLSEAIKILIKCENNKQMLYLLKDISYNLEKGNTLEFVFSKYNFEYKHLVLGFLKIISSKGEIKVVFNSLNKLLIKIVSIKKLFLNSLRYPLILSFATLFCFLLVFIFVLPNLEVLFSSYDNLPNSTKVLFFIKDIFEDYFIFIFLMFFSSLFILYYFLKNNSKIRYLFDKILFLYIPIFKELIYYKNMFIFFESVKTLLKLNYEVNIAIKSSLVLLNNQFILDRMSLINEDLENGLTISEAFHKTGIVDATTLSLLDLGQKSNTLNIIIKDIVKIYKNNFLQIINRISILIEPIFFIIISLLIMWIVLAVFQPIWSISDIIK